MDTKQQSRICIHQEYFYTEPFEEEGRGVGNWQSLWDRMLSEVGRRRKTLVG